MGELIEGFDRSVGDEYARLRGEIAIAIADSGYTMEQVAALAGISRRTLHNLLTGAASVGTDTFIRVTFVVGGRLEVARSEGEDSRPFQVVPSVQSGEGNQRRRRTSSTRSSSSRKTPHLSQEAKIQTNKKAAEKQKRSTRRKRETSWFDVPTVRPARSGPHFARIGPKRIPCDRSCTNEHVRQISNGSDDFVSVAVAA